MRIVSVVSAIAMLALASTAAAMTRDEGKALARSVNLTTADMPDYESSPTKLSDTLAADRAFARCANSVPASMAVASVPSPTFERATETGYQAIYSQVAVLPNAALVQKDLKAMRAKRARNCAVKALRKESGSELARVAVVPLKPAVPNGFGLRIKMLVRVRDQKVPVFMDLLAVGHEDVEAAVVVAGGPFAPSRALEDDLLDTVESRLVAEQNKDTIF